MLLAVCPLPHETGKDLAHAHHLHRYTLYDPLVPEVSGNSESIWAA